MKRTGIHVRLHITLIGLISVVLVWSTAAYEVSRSRSDHLREAEVRTAAQSQIFAEYSESTIKRLDELTQDLRSYWTGDWKAFAELIQRRQEIIKDIAFQVAVIDSNGLLAFSNLAKPDNRTDLSDREHFRAHRDSPEADRLFISKPVKGKVSGKWSIQMTRPILKNGVFDGVLVVSVSPELFSSFATKLQLPAGSVIAVVRGSGEMMARFPLQESSYGQVLKDRPYLLDGGPIYGNDQRIASVDGTERLYGYYKLPALGLIFVIGEPLSGVLSGHNTYRNNVLGVALFVSILASFLFFGLIKSLMALDAMRKALEASTKRADAANLAKSQFLATMSHEIRTPMNGILGMAQLLMMKGLKEEERQEYTRIILSSGQTLLTLLNDILDLSKVEAGRIELERLVFSPAQIINEVAALFAEQAASKGVLVNADWRGPNHAHYRADPIRLRQMLSNLASNAVKFTAQGRIDITGQVVEVKGEQVRLEFSVQDTGIGIAEDKLALLFQPFSQIDSSTTREYGGTGLGLSIVRMLAELMGGHVQVSSQAGQGSRFWFEIQADLVQESEEKRLVERVPVGTVAPSASDEEKRPSVLVVEDNPMNRKVIQALLNKQACFYQCVENGEEALRLVTAGAAFDIVLMDCQMPVMDGFQATKEIRRWESEHEQRRLTIIALTADAFPETRAHCLAVGMDDFLAKPIVYQEMVSVFAKWGIET